MGQWVALSWFVDFGGECWRDFEHIPLHFESGVELILSLHHEILSVLMKPEVSLMNM